MSERSLRLAVPPRDLAATITAQAVLRAGWAVAGVYLFISLVTLGSLWVDRSYGVMALLPLAALLAIAAILVFLAYKPSWQRGVLFLAVGTVSTYFWVFGLLLLDPILNMQGTYLVNRMTVVLLLIGAVSSRLVHGVLWCTAGWFLGSVATVLAQETMELEISPGYGPTVSLIVYLIIIVMFVLIKRSQHRFTSAFSDRQVEPARITGQRELEERAIALIHDTVLNDLATLAISQDKLDERTRARFLADVKAVREAEIEPESLHRDAAQWLRREILTTVSDFQWRGLRVDVTGEAPILQVAPSVAEALAGAIRGCLENVVRHSSSDSAELFVDFSESELSVMVVDQGVGFDVNAIPNDRLGIRQSVIHRVKSVGGHVKIWSTAGAGTSVVITTPLGVDDD